MCKDFLHYNSCGIQFLAVLALNPFRFPVCLICKHYKNCWTGPIYPKIICLKMKLEFKQTIKTFPQVFLLNSSFAGCDIWLILTCFCEGAHLKWADEYLWPQSGKMVTHWCGFWFNFWWNWSLFQFIIDLLLTNRPHNDARIWHFWLFY